HLMTTSSLAKMKQYNSAALWDVKRFRPNFLIETIADTDGFVEVDWCGRLLSIGELQLKCEIPTVRCGMTTHAQTELPRDTTILRTIVRDANQNLGVYASVVKTGRIAVGDEVKLL
ncbi:MAG: MOSC domain-containing protein, partial [Acidobacteriota bacterium]